MRHVESRPLGDLIEMNFEGDWNPALYNKAFVILYDIRSRTTTLILHQCPHLNARLEMIFTLGAANLEGDIVQASLRNTQLSDAEVLYNHLIRISPRIEIGQMCQFVGTQGDTLFAQLVAVKPDHYEVLVRYDEFLDAKYINVNNIAPVTPYVPPITFEPGERVLCPYESNEEGHNRKVGYKIGIYCCLNSERKHEVITGFELGRVTSIKETFEQVFKYEKDYR